MAGTINSLMKEVVNEYLNRIDMNNPPTPPQVECDLIEWVNKEITFRNSVAPKDDKWRKIQCLEPAMIADVILVFHSVRRIILDGVEKGSGYALMVYQTDGEDEGIYVGDENAFKRLIRLYNYSIKDHGINEVIQILNTNAPLCKVNTNPDFIAVNNGIFDYKKKQLLPFSPEIVFTSKSSVNYNEKATVNPVIHNNEDGTDWDVESWMESLSDNPGIVNLLWQVIGAVIRNQVHWDRVICLYSTKGNNGKGTLCTLLRNICGEGNSTAIQFSAFDKDFLLESLPSVSAIITDENDTAVFTKGASALKAVITGDVLQVNRKWQKAISFRFNGLMVQCVNEFPRIGDKSESLYRRFLMIPFEKSFKGKERKYIKEKYLERAEVLEYVLRKVLHMSYYSFDEPMACQELLDVYKEYNDPIRQFVNEIMPRLVWGVVPPKFLYDLYVSWSKKNNPSGIVISQNHFSNDVANIIADSTEWEDRRRSTVRTGNKMDAPEPLIMEYDLKDWMNPGYNGHDIDKRCIPLIKEVCRGWLRKGWKNNYKSGVVIDVISE